MLSGSHPLLSTGPSAAAAVHCQQHEAGNQVPAKLGGELGMRTSVGLGTTKDQSKGSTDALQQRPAGDPWRIASAPDFGCDDSLHGSGALRLPQLPHDQLGGSIADTGSPWTPHNPAQPHPLDPFTSAQAAGFNLPFDGLERSAASVVESVLGRDEFSSKDPGSAQPWNPAGLLGNPSYQMPMNLSGQLRGPSNGIGLDHRADGSSNGATANGHPSKFPAMDRMASHGLGTSPWSTGAAANQMGPQAGNGMSYMDPASRGSGRAMGLSMSPPDGGLADLALEEQNLLGAAMQSLSYQDQMMLQHLANQQAARDDQQMLQQLLLQQQREQQFSAGHNGQQLPGVDILGLSNNIKTARSVPHQAAPAPFSQAGVSRLGDPGRMQSGSMAMGMEEPMSPMQRKLLMQALGQDPLASHGSHGALGLEDGNGNWPQMQEVARLLALQASAPHNMLHEPLTSSGSFTFGSNMGGRGGANTRQGLQPGSGRYDPVDSPNMQRQRPEPRLPQRLIHLANQAGISTQTLWGLLRHPTLLDVLVKERDSMRGSQSAGGSAPAGTPVKGMSSLSTGGTAGGAAGRKLIGVHSSAAEQSIALMDPVKKQEELAKIQATLGEVLKKTATYLQGPQVQEMLATLAPIAALYDSMHDLPVVQKRRKCQEINELRSVLGTQPRIRDAVAVLVKLRQHLYTATEKLLLLSDASSEGVPLDIMLGCICSELLNLLRPLVPQDVLDSYDALLPSPRLALLVFVEFASVDPVPCK